MAYQLHIERDTPISLEDWLEAISGLATLKEDGGAVASVNPVTGERISIPGKSGDVSVLVGGEWRKTFSWNKGRASFKVPSDTSKANPTMATALHLALRLSAVVRGDEGETYHSAD